MARDMKAPIITSKDIVSKEFKKAEGDGYDSEEVDRFLDLVVDALEIYEQNFSRYKSAVDSFEDLNEKVCMQDVTIKKLRNEISELYNNGYNNQAMMRRIQVVEEQTKQQNNSLAERFLKIESLLNAIVRKLK